jgi:hypothetical protein
MQHVTLVVHQHIHCFVIAKKMHRQSAEQWTNKALWEVWRLLLCGAGFRTSSSWRLLSWTPASSVRNSTKSFGAPSPTCGHGMAWL